MGFVTNALRKYVVVNFIFLGLAATAAQNSAPSKPPETPKRDNLETYQGVTVSDPYRWLENSDAAEVKKWTEAQNNFTRAYLDKLPYLNQIKTQLQKWNDFQSASYRGIVYKNGIYFALKLQPPKNQPLLVTLSSLTDLQNEKVIVDPNTIDSSGTTAIDFYEPSPKGDFVAVSLSKGGSEEGTLNVYETSGPKHLPDQIPLVNKPTAGGAATWLGDASGFYYTRYPRVGERAKEDLDFYQQVYFHKLGDDPKDDTYSLGKDLPRIAEIQLATSDDGKFVLARVANGDGGEFSHYLKTANGPWAQVTQFADKVTTAAMGQHGELYLKSLKDSPKGKVLVLAMKDANFKKAKILVKESDVVIQHVVPTDNRLFLVGMAGGPADVREFDLNGKLLGHVPVVALSDVDNLERTTGDTVVYRSQSYVEPASWYLYSPENKKGPVKTALVTKSPVDFADIEVKREFAKSKDGTKIPVNVLYKKGLNRDARNPTILYGYGGYGFSLSPRFSPDLHLWLEHGGVYAIANLRGGGEYGAAWHLAGNLTKKQNVFDDFIACAEFLISAKYTSPGHLAIEGGSNGGLLMGAVLTQKPELFRAVVSHVGIYDMLRVETDPNGAFNVTEFGTVKDAAQFRALYGYSPVHHVSDSRAYPAVLLLTGANDGRVNPYHSKKMAARLQAATSSNNPVLLRVTFDGGHGIGRSVAQKVNEEADVMAFIFEQLGMKY